MLLMFYQDDLQLINTMVITTFLAYVSGMVYDPTNTLVLANNNIVLICFQLSLWNNIDAVDNSINTKIADSNVVF